MATRRGGDGADGKLFKDSSIEERPRWKFFVRGLHSEPQTAVMTENKGNNKSITTEFETKNRILISHIQPSKVETENCFRSKPCRKAAKCYVFYLPSTYISPPWPLTQNLQRDDVFMYLISSPGFIRVKFENHARHTRVGGLSRNKRSPSIPLWLG